MAHVQIRAAGQRHYQIDSPVRAALYCICYYLMSVILSASSCSRCSCGLCPSADLLLFARFFLQPQRISASALLLLLALSFCCLLLPWLLLPACRVAIASSRSSVMAHAFMQILMQNISSIVRGGKERQ